MDRRQRVTELLEQSISAGPGAGVVTSELLPIVYDEMRALAAHFAAGQRAGHTLQPTALAHEAFLRLARTDDPSWDGKAHFMAVAAKAMRQILTNHAEARRAQKRGGGWDRVTLDAGSSLGEVPEVEVLALDEALTRLAALDPRQAQVVELRFFGALSVRDTARLLGVSERTVELDWRMARAWLRKALEETPDERAEP